MSGTKLKMEIGFVTKSSSGGVEKKWPKIPSEEWEMKSAIENVTVNGVPPYTRRPDTDSEWASAYAQRDALIEIAVNYAKTAVSKFAKDLIDAVPVRYPKAVNGKFVFDARNDGWNECRQAIVDFDDSKGIIKIYPDDKPLQTISHHEAGLHGLCAECNPNRRD